MRPFLNILIVAFLAAGFAPAAQADLSWCQRLFHRLVYGLPEAPSPKGFQTLEVNPQILQVLDKVIFYPRVRYRFFPAGTMASEVLRKVLEEKYHQPVALVELNYGATRRIFEHPFDPTKMIKIYDPSIKGMIPLQVAHYIQRELALEKFLKEFGFQVAKIDPTESELLEYGIIIQDKISGPMVGYLKNPPNIYYKHFIDRLARLRAYEDTIIKKMPFAPLGPVKAFTVTSPFRSHLNEKELAFIDRGQGNLIDQPNSEPVFIDW